MLKACLKPLIYRLWKPKIESETDSDARLSGRANVSIRTDTFRTLVMAVQTLNLYNFFLAFQGRQFRPNLIFE